MLSKDIVSFLKKNHGEKICSMADALKEGEKISTGIFALDFCLAGGFPLGKITQIYGPKDAAKTTMALSITGHMQSKGKSCFYIDTENTFDTGWASTLGVDCSSLLVFQPSHGEQIVDIVDGLLSCDDIHFGVLDSLGAIITLNEVESYGEKQIVSGSSGVITKILRKAVHAQLEQSKKECYPTLLCINQVRQKIGVMYGATEYSPGGEMVNHAPSLNLRVSGKSIIDKQYNTNSPTKHHVNITIKKSKMKTLLTHIEFEIGLKNIGDLKAGKSNDAELMLKYLKSFNMVEKNGTGYIVCDQHFKSQKEVKDKIEQDSTWKDFVQQSLIIKGGEQTFLQSEESS